MDRTALILVVILFQLASANAAWAKAKKKKVTSLAPAAAEITAASDYRAVTEELRAKIQKSGIAADRLGVFVAAGDGTTILDHNGSTQMIPASITKIITAGAVLKHFALDQKFFTEIRGSGKVQQGKMQGDICLKGGGDPAFVSEKMWYLVNEFTRWDAREISGDLVVDDTRFDEEAYDSGRDSVRVDRAYDAPVSATSFNWNSVNVFVRPGEKEGAPAIVKLDPENEYVELVNRARTTDGSKKSIEVTREKLAGNKERVIVVGTIGRELSEVVIYKSITRPALWMAYNLKEFLKQRGISFKGVIRQGKCDKEFKVMATAESWGLNLILADMLKYSNNFVAEMLVKNLVAEENLARNVFTPATMGEGIELLKKYLESLGLSRKDFELENVSGLTRKNRFTPQQFDRVLMSLQSGFQTFPEFLSGLPIGGLDGTLKKRMKGTGAENWVRAKTGYLTGVVSLAGYVGRPKASPYRFVFMYNGPSEQDAKVKDFFDRLVLALLEAR